MTSSSRTQGVSPYWNAYEDEDGSNPLNGA